MIKKTDITHGALFAIPLWNSLGFFYGKMLLGSHLKKELGWKSKIFIKVYDHFTNEIVKDFAPDFYKGKELVAYPFFLTGFPKLKGKNSWQFLRHDPVFEEDEFIPYYWEPGMIGELNIPDDAIFGIVRTGNIHDPENRFFPYYRIKHLPVFRIRSYDIISVYLTFVWLKRNGKDIDAPFEYNEGLDVKKEVRFEVMNMTVDYRAIPKEIRGRVAPEKKDKD